MNKKPEQASPPATSTAVMVSEAAATQQVVATLGTAAILPDTIQIKCNTLQIQHSINAHSSLALPGIYRDVIDSKEAGKENQGFLEGSDTKPTYILSFAPTGAVLEYSSNFNNVYKIIPFLSNELLINIYLINCKYVTLGDTGSGITLIAESTSRMFPLRFKFKLKTPIVCLPFNTNESNSVASDKTTKLMEVCILPVKLH